MPSRRELITMTDEERMTFIRSKKTLIIVSNGVGGFPHPMPMWFAIDDDGSVRMSTFRKSQKVKNVQRDPKVSLLVEDGEEYSELRGVHISGTCEIVDDLRAVQDTLVDITGGEAAESQEAREGMYKVIEATAAKRVLLRIKPEKIVSWDHSKLGGTY
ncbi:MAG: pyridoxamine 5'-phosphate oxidase family protein [Deltaproteobacteria bacterium]|nr:pyridoxamine 5'-phosphate oxidase family protein [Deltaproteobacteria bacterium]MBW2362020.1 pyridoxamine 5'-phosphate oxidase family protein [Deltaproteobacteria bacterium]